MKNEHYEICSDTLTFFGFNKNMTVAGLNLQITIDESKKAAQSVHDARAAHPESSLADLYDPIAMPPAPRRTHQALDKAVDAAYGFGRGGPRTALTDAERVAFLFELYHKYTSLLPSP